MQRHSHYVTQTRAPTLTGSVILGGSLNVPDILLLCSMGKAGEVEMERDIAWGTTWNGNSNK